MEENQKVSEKDMEECALMLENMLKQTGGEGGNYNNNSTQNAAFKVVAPKPGFCLKTKSDDGEKVFINICMAENLPEPKDITDEELLVLLNSEDPSGFRVPMSLGDPHAELDNNGHGCNAYDVIINPNFFLKLQNRQLLMGFFLTVVLEGIENKYKTNLSREWKILKNRKFIGTLPEQNVRTKSKPLIEEMGNESSPVEKPISQENKRKIPSPPYTIVREPPTGDPEVLVAEIHLPKIKSASSFTVDVGEDRILLETRVGVYHLDIYLPHNIIQEECGAQFNKSNKILTLTMPVQPILTMS